MSKANKSSYKRLKAKSRARTSKKRDFNQRFNSTLNKLFPKTAPAPKQDKNYDKLINDLETKYADKLARQQQQQQQIEEQAANSRDKNSNVISNLSQQVEQGNKRFEGLSQGVQQALDKIYADKAKEQQAVQATRRQPTTEAQQNTSFPSLEDLESTVATKKTTPSEETKETKETKETTPSETIVKKILNIGDSIDIGNGFTYRATNLYGPRTGANSVPGRKDGEHSRGVDLVSHDAQGNKSNLPIAIAEGTIVNVWRQGSGLPINTRQGKAAGHVVDVLSPNGKIISYAHLGPYIYENKDKFIGNKIQRGDVIVNDNRMSGSGTAPHIKVFMSDSKKNGVSKRNYTDPGNDPTQLILNNSYL